MTRKNSRPAPVIAAFAMLAMSSTGMFAQDYLPLANANKWTLTNQFVTTPMTLTVMSIQDFPGLRRARVEFKNQWFTQTMLLRSTSYGIELEGIGWGAVTSRFLDPIPYFPKGSTAGQQWTRDGVTVKLVAILPSLKTPAGTFSNVKHYLIRFADGASQEWMLAPNVGFVQFGQNATMGFQLASRTLNPFVAAPVSSTSILCPAAGVDANPVSDFSNTGKQAALVKASNAGANFMHVSTSWSELERSPGVFSFGDVDQSLAWASQYGHKVALTVKTIDTSNRALPSDLSSRSWTDPVVKTRFAAFLTALSARLNSRVEWINLGNEIDVYLASNPQQLGQYLEFFAHGRAVIKSLRSTISVGNVFAFDSFRLNDMTFRAALPYEDHAAFTYYALRGTITAASQRSPVEVWPDLTDIVDAAGGKPVILTELGFASSSVVNGSQALQSSFYTNVFNFARNSGGKVKAFNFFLMSEIPASVVNHYTAYYGFSSTSAFGSWLGSLGTHDASGRAKTAWSTFQTQATAFRSSTYCK